MLLKSKYIQPGIQVSVLIRHHLYSCSYTKLGKGGERKAFFCFYCEISVLKCSGVRWV